MMKIFNLILFLIFNLNYANLMDLNSDIKSSKKREIKELTIKNSKGTKVKITNYGARIISLWVSDNKGNFDDIVLGFDSVKDYFVSSEKYFGATIGRYGNRINKGVFYIDNIEYKLNTNDGSNNLHGGTIGYDSVIWDIKNFDETSVTFSYSSYHLEEGFPGNLEIKMKYEITKNNELKIQYWASCDRKTIVNLTHHSFFNLKGAGKGDINDHLLQINASNYTPIDKNLIPTGQIESVEKTPFDFKKLKPIGQDLYLKNNQLKFGNGYDHNFVLNKTKNSINFAAKVIEPDSGRIMEVFTNEPGLQFYGGNFLDGTITGKKNKSYKFRSAFCLETQHFPDSPNNPDFPNTILDPKDEYYSICIYKFSTFQ